jgi:uroporphyrinogen-III synthase
MTDKTLLITRPKGDEKIMTDLLHQQGYRVIHEPLTDIFLRHTERLTIEQALLDDPDVVLITSRHGVQALSLLTEMRDMFLLCVGTATTDAASSLGFTRVEIAGKTVQHMIDYIFASYDPGTRFLYPSGEHVRVELDHVLAAQDMDVRRIAIYEAIAATQLSDTLVEQLRRAQIDGVTFLSQRTAAIFTSLLDKAGVQDTAKNLDAFCMSDGVAAALTPGAWRGVYAADEPVLASMVECVNNTYEP